MAVGTRSTSASSSSSSRTSRDGRRDSGVGDLFSAATPFILPLIGFGILFGIGVTIGFLLLVVPGLILLTFWSVGAPAIVVEGIGPIDAFGRSWRLVRGDAWSVFGTLLVVLLIVHRDRRRPRRDRHADRRRRSRDLDRLDHRRRR